MTTLPAPTLDPAVLDHLGPHRVLSQHTIRGSGGATVVVFVERASEAAATADLRSDRCRARGLTPRETQVALLLADRRTNEEIARAAGISAHTARHHTERVLSKLGLSSRLDVRAAIAGDPLPRRVA